MHQSWCMVRIMNVPTRQMQSAAEINSKRHTSIGMAIYPCSSTDARFLLLRTTDAIEDLLCVVCHRMANSSMPAPVVYQAITDLLQFDRNPRWMQKSCKYLSVLIFIFTFIDTHVQETSRSEYATSLSVHDTRYSQVPRNSRSVESLDTWQIYTAAHHMSNQ